MTRAALARATVRELIDTTGWLAASLLPGTSKPYRGREMSAERRAELDQQARLYRQVVDVGTGAMIPLGESPAPMDLEILELLVEILDAAGGLADLVSTALELPNLPLARSAFADPRPYLDHVRRHVVAADAATNTIAATVHARCENLIFRARSTLGLVTDGQLLDAICPWCGGRTARHPVGGAKTLRVRMLPGDIPAIVCEGGRCEPPTKDVGNRWKGLPAWPLDTEGPWLAERIEATSA